MEGMDAKSFLFYHFIFIVQFGEVVYLGKIFFPYQNASALGVDDEVNVNFDVRVCHIMLFYNILFFRPYGALHIGDLHPQTVG